MLEMEVKQDYGTFAEIAEGFKEEIPCEIDGHGESEGLGIIHTASAVEWKEILSCPQCGDGFELLVCDGVHRFMLGKIIEKDPTKVCDCGKCGYSGTLYEEYVRSVRWG